MVVDTAPLFDAPKIPEPLQLYVRLTDGVYTGFIVTSVFVQVIKGIAAMETDGGVILALTVITASDEQLLMVFVTVQVYVPAFVNVTLLVLVAPDIPDTGPQL